MTLLQLRYFQAVCLHNNVSKAAETMHISQPAISIAIKELEEEFGVSLFIREKKQLTLTNEGVFFLNKVSEILLQIDSLNELMSDLGKKSRVLNLSLIPLSGGNVFIKSLNRFRSTFPDIQVSITECSSSKALEYVRDNVCHAAIVVVGKQKNDALDGLILLQTQYVFCVGKNHPMAQQTTCELSEMANRSLILFEDETALTKELKNRFYKLGITPKVLLYTMNMTLIKELVSEGREGIFLTREIASSIPDMIQISLTEPLEISYALVWKKNPTLNNDLTKLIALVREEYPDAVPYV